MPLTNDTGSNKVQAFALCKDLINLTSGVHTGRAIACAEDGDFTLLKFGVTVSLVRGDAFSFDPQDVTIISGKFHIMS